MTRKKTRAPKRKPSTAVTYFPSPHNEGWSLSTRGHQDRLEYRPDMNSSPTFIMLKEPDGYYLFDGVREIAASDPVAFKHQPPAMSHGALFNAVLQALVSRMIQGGPFYITYWVSPTQ